MPHILTEKFVRDLPIGQRLILDTQQTGFGIRTTDNGTKLFVARCRIGGERRQETIGRWPDLSVAEGRKLARAALDAIRDGRDPKTARHVGTITVTRLANQWLTEHVKPKLHAKTHQNYQSLIDRWITPEIGHRDVASLTKGDVISLHSKMASTPVAANLMVAIVRNMMSFAEDSGLRPPNTNPARKIKLFEERGRDRFMSDVEMARAWAAIAEAERTKRIGLWSAAGLRLLMQTGARRNDIAKCRWQDVHLDRKVIVRQEHKSRGKTKKPKVIYLNDAACDVIRSLPHVVGRPFILINRVGNGGYKSLTNAWIKTRGLAGLGDVRLHDMRHGFASKALRNGATLADIAKLLSITMKTAERYAHLAQDHASEVNDRVGDAIATAIMTGAPKIEQSKVIALGKRRRK